MDDDGTFEPPLVVVSGELFFPFDELETLKATLTAVSSTNTAPVAPAPSLTVSPTA